VVSGIKGEGDAVAITSKGYAGTVDDVDWSALATHMGVTYAVFEPDAFTLSPGPGDRQVVISAGTAAGEGVLDTSDSNVTLGADLVVSGSRWDMVVLHRDWSAKVTSLAIIPGSASKALPARELREEGTEDDQPLYLVRFSAGQTAVQEVVDLRVWFGNGGLVAKNSMVRDYMNRVGTRLRVGSKVWERLPGTGGPEWHDQMDLQGPTPIGYGGTGANDVMAALINLGAVSFDVGSVTVPANGSVTRTVPTPAALGSLADYAVVVSLSNSVLRANWGRTGRNVTVEIFNDTNQQRTTAAATVTLNRLWTGVTPPPI
jgi:hypothetical protein